MATGTASMMASTQAQNQLGQQNSLYNQYNPSVPGNILPWLGGTIGGQSVYVNMQGTSPVPSTKLKRGESVTLKNGSVFTAPTTGHYILHHNNAVKIDSNRHYEHDNFFTGKYYFVDYESEDVLMFNSKEEYEKFLYNKTFNNKFDDLLKEETND